MKENEIKAERTSTFSKKLENFWYHYKWHSIIAAFLVLVFTVCSLQMCNKTSYDVHVMYAGSGRLSMTAPDADTPDYMKAISTLTKYSSDYNGDGEINPNLLALFVPTAEEIKEINASLSKGESVDTSVVSSNTTTFKDNMLYGEYYLCLLSEEWFFEYDKTDGIFESISSYTSNTREYEYANERGIYLRSLDIYERDGIKELPEDTVVCIRRLSAVSIKFDKDGQTAAHDAAAKLLAEMLK